MITQATARNMATMMGAFVDDSSFAEERKLLREVFSPETRDGAVTWVYNYDQRYYKVLSACAKLRLRTRNLPEGNPTYIEIRDADWRTVFGGDLPLAETASPSIMPLPVESYVAAEPDAPTAEQEDIIAAIAEDDELDMEQAVEALANSQPPSLKSASVEEDAFLEDSVSIEASEADTAEAIEAFVEEEEAPVAIQPPAGIDVPAIPDVFLQPTLVVPPVVIEPVPVAAPPVAPSLTMPTMPVMPPAYAAVSFSPPVPPVMPATVPVPVLFPPAAFTAPPAPLAPTLQPYAMPVESAAGDRLEVDFAPNPVAITPKLSLDERRNRTRDASMSAFRAREVALQTREEAVRLREETLRRREDSLEVTEDELRVGEEHIGEKTKELQKRGQELDILKQKLDQEIEKIRTQKSEIMALASHTQQVGTALLKNLP